MSDILKIKQSIEKTNRTNPNIRVNVSFAQPKIRLSDVEAKIVGVYAHIFQIEDLTLSQKQRYTLQYTDILLGNIELLDMD